MCQFLQSIDEAEIRRLGTALGLNYTKLNKMKTLPDDMVAAWLRREDQVEEMSGMPSWSQLADKLQEIGQTGIATDIKNATGARMHSVLQEAGSIDVKTGIIRNAVS